LNAGVVRGNKNLNGIGKSSLQEILQEMRNSCFGGDVADENAGFAIGVIRHGLILLEDGTMG
jgi:hypothetical protein